MALQQDLERVVVSLHETETLFEEYDIYLLLYFYRLFTRDRDFGGDTPDVHAFYPDLPGTSEISKTLNGSGRLLEGLKKFYDLGFFKALSLHLHKNHRYIGAFNFDGTKNSFPGETIKELTGILPFNNSVEQYVDSGALVEVEFGIESKIFLDFFNKIIESYKENTGLFMFGPLTAGKDNLEELGLSWKKQMLNFIKLIKKQADEHGDPERPIININLEEIPLSINLPEAIITLLFDPEYKKENYDVNIVFSDMLPTSLEIIYSNNNLLSKKSSRKKKLLHYDKEARIVYVDKTETTSALGDPKFQSGSKRTTFQTEELFLALYDNIGSKIGYEDIDISSTRNKKDACQDALKEFKKKVILLQGKKSKKKMIEIIMYGAGKYWIDSDVYESGTENSDSK